MAQNIEAECEERSEPLPADTSWIKDKYPLHWLVWNNDYRELELELRSEKHGKELLDPRGRTPLMLAVTLAHLESTRILLRYNCNVAAEGSIGWTVVQEATSTGDPELLEAVLESREMERYSSRVAGIPQLLNKLKEAPDFYVEMKWEFTSWMPLVSRMCPSDTYKVFKRGSYVRIDTTLLGFDRTHWQRGSHSYIFKGQAEGAVMMEVDHDAHQVYVETIETPNAEQIRAYVKPHPTVIAHRLTAPIVTTFIDTDKISFERDKAGIWGWRSDRSEVVNGHFCKVFSASNVELVTKTRTEHQTDADKQQNNSARTPLQSFLNIAETEEKQKSPTSDEKDSSMKNNPSNITPQEYFDSSVDLRGRDIGRPKEVSTKIQRFKAHLWLAEEYPLKLQEQVMPIVDLMAISSSHFAKLKDFIQLQLPSGFPVKIEIPLFHVLTARITFGNIFAFDEPVDKVSTLQEEDRITCIVEDSVFEAPSGYSFLGTSDNTGPRHIAAADEDDALLQYAIQQSLVDMSSAAPTQDEQIDIWEALQAHYRPSQGSSANVSPCRNPSQPMQSPDLMVHSFEDAQLQRAIEESLALSQANPGSHSTTTADDSHQGDNSESAGDNPDKVVVDTDIALALSLSKRHMEEEEARRKQEEETLERILQLSLTEK